MKLEPGGTRGNGTCVPGPAHERASGWHCTRVITFPFAGNWEVVRQHCLQILEPFILGDKDAILPALGNTAQSETLVVVGLY